MAPVKTTVKVWVPKAAGMEPKQILTSIKTYIPKAMAVKIMHSGNVEVILPNQQAKDQAITQKNTPKCKILRQNYLVKIIGVPFSIPVDNKQGATNTQFIQKINKAIKKLVLGIAITKILWLYKVRTIHIRVLPKFQRVKTRGTLIVSRLI